MPGTGVKQNLFAINMILRMTRKIRRSRNYGHDRRRSTDDLSNGEYYKKDSKNNKKKHQMAFYAIVTLTQMDINKSNVLFSVGVTALQRKRNYKF